MQTLKNEIRESIWAAFTAPDPGLRNVRVTRKLGAKVKFRSGTFPEVRGTVRSRNILLLRVMAATPSLSVGLEVEINQLWRHQCFHMQECNARSFFILRPWSRRQEKLALPVCPKARWLPISILCSQSEAIQLSIKWWTNNVIHPYNGNAPNVPKLDILK